MTMTLEQVRDWLEPRYKNQPDDVYDAVEAAIRERDDLRESLMSRTAHIAIPTEAIQQECVAYARPFKDRAERAEAECRDLHKRLSDMRSERNTIRRERAQEHRKHAREKAELAALKARIADAPTAYLTSKTGVGPCNIASMAHGVVFDANSYGKHVRLLVDE